MDGVPPRETEYLIALFKQLPLGVGLPDAVVAQIAQLATVSEHASGQTLFREGSTHERLLIILEGRVALDMHVPGRGDVRILSLGPGDVVAWSALIGNARMTTSAVTLEDSRILSIRARDLLSLCETDHTLGYFVMRHIGHALANRLVATRLQMLDVFSDDPAPIPLSSP